MLPYLEIAGLSIPTFGLMLVAGYIAAQILVATRFEELGWPADWAAEGVFCAAAGGLAGAAIHFIVQHASEFGDDPVDLILEGTGLVWFGGFAGGVIAVVAWGSWRGVLGLQLLDIGAIAIAAGQALGRIGCQLSGDGDYGEPSDLPWAMGYPDGTVPTPPGVEVHPTPVYEAIVLALICAWLWRKRDSFQPGVIAAGYLILMGSMRFLVEFIRLNDDVIAGLTIPQLWSLAAVAIGSALLLSLTRLRAQPT